VRLPNSKDMSAEQKKVYLNAPLDGSILVTGPPGTGKTVIAFLRADTFARKYKGNASVTVMMYNKVLQRYTEGASTVDGVKVSTMHSWINRWWSKTGISVEDQIDRYDLTCPYDEKDEAKALGARWDKVKKKWWVSVDNYEKNQDEFDQWCPSPVGNSGPPTIGDQWTYDWTKMTLAALADVQKKENSNLNWGHLVVDEAQDFSKEMFNFFTLLSKQENMLKLKYPPGLTVFADENQRLNMSENSTIDDIRKSLMIPSDREFSLTRNYRNTRPIAEFAKEFYVGLQTGIPDLPDEEGDLPLVFSGNELNDSVEFINRYAVLHDDKQIGVIVQNNKVRKKFYNKLSHRLSGEEVEVQTYASGDPEHRDTKNLDLDGPGVLTVVNKQSCKGLEFDSVFLVELQEIDTDPSAIDQFKMEMYVMCSRAREYLALMFSNSGDAQPSFLSYLPKEDQGLFEWS